MMRPLPTASVLVAGLALLGSAGGTTAQVDPSASPPCWVQGDPADLELRASPFDSTSVRLEPGPVKVCYSRPRKLGRPIMGRLVPYGEPWRLGADEATAIHLPAPGTVAGMELDPGWYTLYVIPGQEEWQVVVNGEIRRWGIPIDDEIRSSDIGTGTVPVEASDERVELLTLRLERRSASAADLVVAWDHTLVRIPVVLSDSGEGGRP